MCETGTENGSDPATDFRGDEPRDRAARAAESPLRSPRGSAPWRTDAEVPAWTKRQGDPRRASARRGRAGCTPLWAGEGSSFGVARRLTARSTLVGWCVGAVNGTGHEAARCRSLDRARDDGSDSTRVLVTPNLTPDQSVQGRVALGTGDRRSGEAAAG